MKKWMLTAIFTIAAFAVSLLAYAGLPGQLTVHFDSSRQPDRWMPKEIGAFLLPAIILASAVFMRLIVKLERNDNKRLRMESNISSVSSVESAVLFTAHLFLLGYNLGYMLDVAVCATIIVGMLFICLGNLLPRLGQSSKQWPKLPEHVQGKAARFQGKLMVILGFVFVLLVLLPADYMLPAFFVCLAVFLLSTLGSIIYYYRLSR